MLKSPRNTGTTFRRKPSGVQLVHRRVSPEVTNQLQFALDRAGGDTQLLGDLAVVVAFHLSHRYRS